MIKIDKSDKLYKYLIGLKVEDVESKYIELAENGRYRRADVQAYFQETFRPSATNDLTDSELERVLDYYIDLKKTKSINNTKLKQIINEYKKTGDRLLRDLVINSKLKDVMHLCLNYSSLHKDIDIQDLIQVANIGLLTAIDKYDDTAGIDFNDYVIYYTREEILKEFEEKKND